MQASGKRKVAASGNAALGAGSMTIAGSVDVEYDRSQDADQLTITQAEFEAEGSGLFNANVEAKDLILSKNSDDKWQAESWNATAQLGIDTSSQGFPLKADTQADITYKRDENNNSREVFTVNSAEIELDVADVAKLSGDAQMQYVIDKSQNQKYWDYVVGELGVEGPIEFGAFQFEAAAGVSMSYGEIPKGTTGTKDSLFGINGSLAFDGVGGPLQYLEISAGQDSATSVDEMREKFISLKNQTTFDQLANAGIPTNSWQFGAITGQIDAPLNLGFVDVGNFGVTVNGNVGNTSIPYGFFKYNDSDVTLTLMHLVLPGN